MSDHTDPVEQRNALTHWLVGDKHSRAYHYDAHFKQAVDMLAMMLPAMVDGLAVASAASTADDTRRLVESMYDPHPTWLLDSDQAREMFADLVEGKEPKSRDQIVEEMRTSVVRSYQDTVGLDSEVPSAWTEWTCPECQWHTLSVEREQHTCPGSSDG